MTLPANAPDPAKGPWVIVPRDFVIPPPEPAKIASVTFVFDEDQSVTFLVLESILDDSDLSAKLRDMAEEEHSSRINSNERHSPVPRPAVSYGLFELRPDGVYKIESRKSQDGSEEEPTYICSWLEVTALSRNEEGNEWGTVLTWHDPDHREHVWSAPRSLLVNQKTDLVEALARRPKEVKQYVNHVTPGKRMLNVPRTGWHDLKHRRVFVLPPDMVIGATALREDEEHVIFQSEAYDSDQRPVMSGSLGDWQSNEARLCVGNDLLVFSTCAAFAAPTLYLLGKDSGGFHLHGDSSMGKTTALRVAASVWGYPMQSWRTTDNALEDTAERHNDVLLALDELSEIDPAHAAKVAYMLGNGGGKDRMGQHGVAQRKRHWRLLFLSTGEVTLADHSEAGGVKTKAGTEVRMVNLDADAGAGMGLFQTLRDIENHDGKPNPAGFASLLKSSTEKYRGTAGPAFVECVIKNESAVTKDLHAWVQDFVVKQQLPPEASGEISRVAERFGLVGAAGEVASKAGITGWKPGTAMRAASWCFQRWLSGRPTAGSSDLEKAIAGIRRFVLSNESRFEDLDKNDPRTIPNRVGFRKAVGDGVEYLVPPEAFKTELCKGYGDSKKVAPGSTKDRQPRKEPDLVLRHSKLDFDRWERWERLW
jgi:putative DNA primase/helicase